MVEETTANDALDLLSNTALMKPSVAPGAPPEDHEEVSGQGSPVDSRSPDAVGTDVKAERRSAVHAEHERAATLSPAQIENGTGPDQRVEPQAPQPVRAAPRHDHSLEHSHALANGASVSSDSADPPQRRAPFSHPGHPSSPSGAEGRSENDIRPFAMYPGSAFYPPIPYGAGAHGHPIPPGQPAYYSHHHAHQHHYMQAAPVPVPGVSARQISPTMHSPYHHQDNGATPNYYQPPMHHHQHAGRDHPPTGYGPPVPPPYMHHQPAASDSNSKPDEHAESDLYKENQQLRAKLMEKDEHLAHMHSKVDYLEKQIIELRQLPTGKISHIPIDDMLRIMHEYGSEVSNQTLPQRKTNIKKASIVRQFRRWNPEFFRYFIHVNGEWVPKLGKEGEQRRRIEKRRTLKAQKGTELEDIRMN